MQDCMMGGWQEDKEMGFSALGCRFPEPSVYAATPAAAAATAPATPAAATAAATISAAIVAAATEATSHELAARSDSYEGHKSLLLISKQHKDFKAFARRK